MSGFGADANFAKRPVADIGENVCSDYRDKPIQH